MSYRDSPGSTPSTPGQEFINHSTNIVKNKRARNLILLLLAAAVFITIAASHQYPEKSHALVAKLGSHFKASSHFIPTSGDPRDLPNNIYLDEPKYVRDPENLLYYPEVQVNTVKRANAAIVSLVRNSELDAMKSSMQVLEARFNRKFGYPWVFMSEVPFTRDFKKGVRSMTRSQVHFHLIPASDWDYPSNINLTRAAEERKRMENDNVIYGGSEPYRKMCRFNSGLFYRQSILESYDYYWRVEPGVDFYCDIDYDPFLFMSINKKIYGFTITLYEYLRTIESFWGTVQSFAKKHPEHIAENNSMDFLLNDPSQGMDSSYNLCHFWSNFEIGDLRFYRSKAYSDYFDYLDATGNFFYERWGDAPVHSIAAALFLPTEAVHQFDDISYNHNPYKHMPSDPKLYESGKCSGDPKDSFDLDGYSCMSKWWQVAGRT